MVHSALPAHEEVVHLFCRGRALVLLLLLELLLELLVLELVLGLGLGLRVE